MNDEEGRKEGRKEGKGEEQTSTNRLPKLSTSAAP